MQKFIQFPSVYLASSMCQALCSALGVEQYMRQKQPLPLMSRKTGREDKHANIISKDCGKKIKRLNQEDSTAENGTWVYPKPGWALTRGWLTSAAVIFIILKITQPQTLEKGL